MKLTYLYQDDDLSGIEISGDKTAVYISHRLAVEDGKYAELWSAQRLPGIPKRFHQNCRLKTVFSRVNQLFYRESLMHLREQSRKTKDAVFRHSCQHQKNRRSHGVTFFERPAPRVSFLFGMLTKKERCILHNSPFSNG